MSQFEGICEQCGGNLYGQKIIGENQIKLFTNQMKKFKRMNNKLKVYLFSAKEWCAGCRKLEPLFYDEVKKLGVKYEVIDVESDEGVDLSVKYTVRNVPTLLFFKNGEVVGRETGSQAHLKIKDYL